ncbi:MAG: methylated-DNA--[protein]-cysteine S-methyltransferase [Lachnospiraceae bacterium]|nr:methylated-DNA--[protein]-cysteine S-methyltransferase [Lachnospiraceae bacterium]
MAESCLYNSPIGVLKISEHNGEITGLSLNSKSDEAKLQQNQQSINNDGQCTREQCSELLAEACRQLDEYFQGQRQTFDLPIAYAGTPFQEKVWKELRNIPYGETRSYEDIAIGVGSPRAVRAVGQANHRNPILLIIPCHRVIHKNGDISGFACGIETKKYLLDLERLHFFK